MILSLYGPPGVGKTSLGRRLAQALERPFFDLDEAIVAQAGVTIAEIFSQQGEAAFRALEKQLLLAAIAAGGPQVIALGGGALLDPESRAAVEAAGPVLRLHAETAVLQARLQASDLARPLLRGAQAAHEAERLQALLAARAAHYASFPRQLDVSSENLDDLTWQAQTALGVFRFSSMASAWHPAYDARVGAGGLAGVGTALGELGFQGGQAAIISDTHVAPLYAPAVAAALQAAGFSPVTLTIPAGEASKTLATAQLLWGQLLEEAQLDRAGPVVALGGGVVGDLAGFAAAVYLRGAPWINLPTSLLAMVDAALGGKTGVDLPQAKNLVGAFHPPRLVLADVDVLATLPEAEKRSGLAEVVKHGVLGDPQLFALCARGWDFVNAHLEEIVRQAVAVKARVVALDPYERGIRAALNLGHTVGHALEQASAYTLRHGEAVAIGMVIEARLSETLGLAQPGLADQIAAVLTGLGLPVSPPPGLQQDWEQLAAIMRFDKKRQAGVVKFALPQTIGKVQVNVPVVNLEALRPWLDTAR